MLEIAGRAVTVTSPDKVFFGERGETKLDLVRYYLAVEEPFLRASGGRPTLMQRFPNGAEGKSFFQKRVPEGAPEWLETTIVETPNGTTARALVLADMAHVAWAVNLACLGFHVWPYSRRAPRGHRRATARPRPAARCRLRGSARRGARGARAARRARNRRLPEDDREPRRARLRPARAPLGLLRRPARGGRGRPRARAPQPRPDHRRLVEGGARPAHLRRLQPERAAQDRLRRLVGARPSRRAGLGAPRLGRGRHRPPRRADDRERPGAPRGAGRPVGGR